MKASVLSGPRSSRLVELPSPEPGPGDVLIAVKACGVCGSEDYDWTGARGRYPFRLGHEASGVVQAVGGQVSCLSPGDRVTGLFREAFAERALAAAAWVRRVPEALCFEEAALGEPPLCAVSGALRIDVGLGKTAVVIGTGFMGLLMLQLLRLRGACRLVAVDGRREALDRALAYGAEEAYLPEELPPNYRVHAVREPGGVDIAVECAGRQETLNLAVEMLKPHSVLAIVGFHQGPGRMIDMEALNWKAAQVINAHEKRDEVKMACLEIGMRLVEKGQIRLGEFVTHRYGLEEVDRAFQDYETKPAGYVKGVVVP